MLTSLWSRPAYPALVIAFVIASQVVHDAPNTTCSRGTSFIRITSGIHRLSVVYFCGSLQESALVEKLAPAVLPFYSAEITELSPTLATVGVIVSSALCVLRKYSRHVKAACMKLNHGGTFGTTLPPLFIGHLKNSLERLVSRTVTLVCGLLAGYASRSLAVRALGHPVLEHRRRDECRAIWLMTIEPVRGRELDGLFLELLD